MGIKADENAATLFIRAVPLELKTAIVATVDDMNENRAPGEPLHTVGSYVLGVLYALHTAHNLKTDVVLTKAPRTAVKKAAARGK